MQFRLPLDRGAVRLDTANPLFLAVSLILMYWATQASRTPNGTTLART